ncbi:hypothetical protein HDV06_005745 [Boothiomyces sp. JEL0866]|nr:hypothetical protein HDV06_005745 [Boothiomyces sp. JEL0866]
MKLPTEIWIQIASYLDAQTLLLISSLSKAFNAISNDEKFWKKQCVLHDYLPLIQDMSVDINWKDFFLKQHRLKQRNMFLDMLTKRASDTIFSTNFQFVHGCEECDRDDFVTTRVRSILWDHGADNKSNFIKHTLDRGCLWSNRVKIPRGFILDRNEEDVPDLSRLLLVSHRV